MPELWLVCCFVLFCLHLCVLMFPEVYPTMTRIFGTPERKKIGHRVSVRYPWRVSAALGDFRCFTLVFAAFR